ncbi:family 10 glycosylhydrolase [Candidatus Sumerlaeota bacterium]|nr:family 10 glycosylhydrolase [Candidatus Sumerlaeota bacterium]
MRALGIALGLIALAMMSPAVAQGDEQVPVALWVDGHSRAFRSTEAMETLLADVRGAGIDTIIAVLRSQGDALFNSTFEPAPDFLTSDFTDPLLSLQRHCRSGLRGEPQVHLLLGISVLDVHRGLALPPRGHVINEHPEWQLESINGAVEAREDGVVHHFLDPSLIEVHQHTEDLLTELVASYNLEGIVLDTLRFPEGGNEWGYCAMALEQYHRDVGEVGIPAPEDPTWIQWRRDQVTDLLREISSTIRIVNPQLPIWVTALAAGSLSDGFESSHTYTEYLQDWPAWIDEGLCDGIILENFRDNRDRNQAIEFVEWMREARAICGDRVSLMVAVSGRDNHRTHLFQQLRSVLAADLGVVIVDYDRTARDSDAGFFTDLHTVLQAQHSRTIGAETTPPDSPEPLAASPEALMPEMATDTGIPEDPFGLTSEPASPSAMALPDDAEPITSGNTEPVEPITSSNPSSVAETLPPPDDITTVQHPPMELPPLRPLDTTLEVPTGIFDDLPPSTVPSAREIPNQILGGRDAVILSDGRRLTGEIIEEGENMITLRLTSGNLVQFPRSRVDRIVRGDQ